MYRVQCVFSRNWALREAALKKMRAMLGGWEKDPGLHAAVAPLAVVLRVSVEDKIAQVMAAAVSLLEDVLKAMKR